MQALVIHANTPFTIPKQLDVCARNFSDQRRYISPQNKIDIHSIRTLLSSSLADYVKKSGGDTPSGIMKVGLLFLDAVNVNLGIDPRACRRLGCPTGGH
jgi:hypothetical protein